MLFSLEDFIAKYPCIFCKSKLSNIKNTRFGPEVSCSKCSYPNSKSSPYWIELSIDDNSFNIEIDHFKAKTYLSLKVDNKNNLYFIDYLEPHLLEMPIPFEQFNKFMTDLNYCATKAKKLLLLL